MHGGSLKLQVNLPMVDQFTHKVTNLLHVCYRGEDSFTDESKLYDSPEAVTRFSPGWGHCVVILSTQGVIPAVVIGCVSLRKSKIGFVKSERIWKRILFFFVTQINPKSLGSWCFKGTEESTLEMDLSVPLTHHDARDLGLMCLIEKHKIHFRILSDLRIQSWIFLKKHTHSYVFGQLCPSGKLPMRFTLCEAPTRETRPDQSTVYKRLPGKSTVW